MDKEPDFKKLDAKINYNYRKDLYESLEELGYTYVSQFVYHLYVKKEKPASKISKKIDISQSQIYSWMQTWEFKTRSRGGNVRNDILKRKSIIEFIRCLKGVMSPKEAAESIGCSYSTIRNIWSTSN